MVYWNVYPKAVLKKRSYMRELPARLQAGNPQIELLIVSRWHRRRHMFQTQG
jgi:hypothetical protein